MSIYEQATPAAIAIATLSVCFGACIWSAWAEYRLRRDIDTDAQMRRGFKLLQKWGRLP